MVHDLETKQGKAKMKLQTGGGGGYEKMKYG